MTGCRVLPLTFGSDNPGRPLRCVGDVADRGVGVSAYGLDHAVGGCPLFPGSPGNNPGKLLKMCTQNAAFWCNIWWKVYIWQRLHIMNQNLGTIWAESGKRDSNCRFLDCPGESWMVDNPICDFRKFCREKFTTLIIRTSINGHSTYLQSEWLSFGTHLVLSQ